MASGVTVCQECKEEFQSIKLKHCYKYIIYKLNKEMTHIEVEKKASKDAKFKDFREDLMAAESAQECRYAVYDYNFTGNDGAREKLVFVFWSPDNSKVKQKMVYAASKDALLKSLEQGIAKVIHMSECSELSIATIREELGLPKLSESECQQEEEG